MPKILVVDDEIQFTMMVQVRLESKGYEVISAVDGEEGLEKVKSDNPDLIITDVMMPKMDGFQLCELLKNDEQHCGIPIIILTGRAQDNDEQLAMKVSANAYFTKPFDAPVLLAKIEELLKG